MLREHSFMSVPQGLPVYSFAFLPLTATSASALLGNKAIQMVRYVGYQPAPAKPVSKLEEMKRRRFTPETRAERVAMSLAALYQETSIRLTGEQWRELVQDSDIYDEL